MREKYPFMQHSVHINSSFPSAAYMHQWTRSALVQVMACRLFGAKPLLEPMLAYCKLHSWEQISVNSVIFVKENAFEIVDWQNGDHSVQGEMTVMSSQIC